MTSKEPYFDENKMFHHPCGIPDCPHEGCIGENVNLLKGKLGRWYCGPHYRELEEKRKNQQAEDITPPPKQGQLI